MATKFRQITKFPKVNYGNYSKRIIIPPLGKPPAHLENGWVERANKLGVNGRVPLNYYRSQITGG